VYKYEQQAIKVKHKSKGRKNANTRCVIKEEIEELNEKPLCHPPRGKSIH